MSARLMTRIPVMLVAAALAFPAVSLAQTQKPKPQPAPARRPPPPQSKSVQIGGYGMIGNINFTAKESFDAILGSSSGFIFGGGARVGLPYGGLFIDVGAWRFSADGQRVFVLNDQVYPLNVATRISVTPLEFSGGWRFRIRQAPKLTPYLGGGFTAMTYSETSDSATDAENVDEVFSGYHLLGGAEYKLTRWLGIAGEATWTSVPDAIGEEGVAAAFDETNLGGASFRLKITIGR